MFLWKEELEDLKTLEQWLQPEQPDDEQHTVGFYPSQLVPDGEDNEEEDGKKGRSVEGREGVGCTGLSNAVERNFCPSPMGRKVKTGIPTKSPNLNELINRRSQELGI